MDNKTRIKQGKEDIVGRYGPWTAHCIHLGEDIYTFDGLQVAQADSRLRRYLQIAADIVSGPLDKIHVLDLASLEGHFGIEFALHGANVVCIEGREANLKKTEFVKEVLSLGNLQLLQNDVRVLSRERFGGYDVILVLGILYHLDAPDVMDFVANIYESCDRVAIIDTHFSLEPRESYTWKGNVYWGEHYEEHKPDSTEKEMIDALWASIGNQRSFQLTRASLCNLLRHVGFSSVYECLNPYEDHNANWPFAPKDDQRAVWKNRTTFVAIKGQKQRIISSPITQATSENDRPEIPEYLTGPRVPGQRKNRVHELLASLPEPMKRGLRKIYYGVRPHAKK